MAFTPTPGYKLRMLPSDGTLRIFVDLVDDPEALVDCTFGSGQDQDGKPVEPAVGVWYMPLGCTALRPDSFASRGMAGFSVQPLCLHHEYRQEPNYGQNWSSDPTKPGHLTGGSHILLDLNTEARFDDPPPLRLGYSMDDLRAFAQTDIGRLVFSGYQEMLD